MAQMPPKTTRKLPQKFRARSTKGRRIEGGAGTRREAKEVGGDCKIECGTRQTSPNSRRLEKHKQRLDMNALMKTTCVAALALGLTTLGAPQARAWGGGWPIAAGVFGGLAVGTAVGATVASAAAPGYYAVPPPGYYAPPPAYVPAPAYAPAPAYYYGPRVVYTAPYPYARVGYGWGPRYYYGGRYYYRR
jgi:hypothetical protein